jgi:hypothetical protein
MSDTTPAQPPAPTVPPIEDERGPQNPIREPGPKGPPERVAGGPAT